MECDHDVVVSEGGGGGGRLVIAGAVRGKVQTKGFWVRSFRVVPPGVSAQRKDGAFWGVATGEAK